MKKMFAFAAALTASALLFGSCGLINPCRECGARPSRGFKTDSGTVYYCEHCSACSICGSTGNTKLYSTLLGDLFVCEDCSGQISDVTDAIGGLFE